MGYVATLMFEDTNGVDLSRLNEAERQVLRLLAEGHTAKSIANELGSTPTAVKERLREARRKTGAGSSRELARLLKSQENRHDEMGVARSRSPIAAFSPSDAEPWRPQMGVVVMLTMFFVIAAGSATLMTQAPQARSDVDPLVGAPLERFKQPVDLHTQVRTEKRDDEWARLTEDAIRARLLQIPLIGRDGNVLRVTCASTLCEIAGTVIDPSSKAEQEDPKSLFNRTIQDLQVPPLPDDLAKLGLKHESGSFFGGKGKPDRSVFLLYYTRVKA
jgi:DNA-binding CsgD family transcriptional regulator